MSFNSLSVSVVIVSHNEGENLPRTVHNLLATLPRGGEIIVVDDASTDHSAQAVAERYSWVKVIRPATRQGVARARNLGAQQARGQVIVFADAHVEAPVEWVEYMLPVLEQPGVGAVSPVISVMHHRESKAYGFEWKDAELNIRWLGQQSDQPYPVPMLPGAFIVMSRDVFEATGGFDPGMILYGAEDAEFSFRLWTLGYECWLAPQVDVAHLFRSALPYRVTSDTVLHNLLRIAFVHLNVERTQRVIQCLVQNGAFPAALATLSASDVWARRNAVRGARRRDDDWFFERFGLQI